MKLLLDECLPRKLKVHFEGASHACETVREAGFASKSNGELLSAAEGIYDVLLTIDKNIRHQQSMTGRRIAILVFRSRSNDIDDLLPLVPSALAALAQIKPGTTVDVD